MEASTAHTFNYVQQKVENVCFMAQICVQVLLFQQGACTSAMPNEHVFLCCPVFYFLEIDGIMPYRLARKRLLAFGVSSTKNWELSAIVFVVGGMSALSK